MSATLVLALVAGMAVPGDAPGAVSAEMKRGLDLGGEWEGVMMTGQADYEVHAYGSTGPKAQWSYRPLPRGRQGPAYLSPRILDEGGGRLRLMWRDDPCLGIYEQDGDRLTICFRAARQDRPSSFRAGDGQHLLILHRVRPRE